MAKRLLSDERDLLHPQLAANVSKSARKVLDAPRAEVSGSGLGSVEIARWIAAPYIAGGAQHS